MAINQNDTIYASDITTALDGKSDNGHTHDDRYYTESEVANNFFNVNNTAFGSNYFIFNNNLKICWGIYGQLATNHGSNTVRFPITFVSAPVVTISVNESNGGWDYQEVVVDNIYTTYFTCRAADTQGGKYIRYIAIGY